MRIIFIAILTAITAFSLDAQGLQRNNLIVRVIDEKYMKACETGTADCKPVMISRQTFKDSIQLILPIGGSQSNVNLYTIDSAFINWTKGGLKEEPGPIRSDERFFGQGNPMLDLTGLQDGNYVVWMTSCNLEGIINMTISTRSSGAFTAATPTGRN